MIRALRPQLRANLLMLAAALIWGSAFVAQRLSLDTIGPFLFTGLRFLLGALVVASLMAAQRRSPQRTRAGLATNAPLLRAGVLLGVLLAAAISLQQIGLRYTKIANAGFISSLYVVIVPLCGLVRGHRTSIAAGAGAALAALGLYLLSVGEHFTVMRGDGYQLAGALLIALHVMLVGRYARRHDPLALSVVQFVACGLACCAAALATEPVRLADIVRAAPTIVYGGALSVGIGYTIQVVAQRDAAPAHAAVIFSMEGMFAALAGWLALGETLTPRALAGCALMLAGLIACQWRPARTATHEAQTAAATVD